jgi:hypothetical protein
MREGDRVRLKKDHAATGTIDEVWTDDGVPTMAAIVWDISGCCSEGPLADLEKIEE